MGKKTKDSLYGQTVELKVKKLSAADSGEQVAPHDVQILRTGTFRDFFSEFEISKKMLKQMEKNFNEGVQRTDLMVDFSHENWGKAAGWFQELELKENGNELWAVIDWTPNANKKIVEKEFRYFSAELSFDHQDNETGKKFGATLLGAGLTNRPFIKDMQPTTQLSEDERKLAMEKKMEELTSENKTLSESVKTLSDQNKQLKTDAIVSKAEIKKLQDEKINSAKEAKFNKLLTDGKAVAAQKEAYMSGDFEKFAELQENVNLSGSGSGADSKTLSKEKAEDKVIELAEKKMEKNKDLDMGTATSEVLDENKELDKIING